MQRDKQQLRRDRYGSQRYREEIINQSAKVFTNLFELRKIIKGRQEATYVEDFMTEIREDLDNLYWILEKKFDYTSVDVPARLQAKMDWKGAYGLSFDEIDRLCRLIRNLLEELGYTRPEQRRHTEQGYGNEAKTSR